MSVEEIEAAVADLDEAALRRFRKWFAEFDGAAWDRQIEADTSSGALDALAEDALRAHRSGASREL